MDGGIITVIGGNRTAITATVSPPNASYNQMTVLPGGGGDGQRDEDGGSAGSAARLGKLNNESSCEMGATA
jgi:hypothetical protein